MGPYMHTFGRYVCIITSTSVSNTSLQTRSSKYGEK